MFNMSIMNMSLSSLCMFQPVIWRHVWMTSPLLQHVLHVSLETVIQKATRHQNEACTQLNLQIATSNKTSPQSLHNVSFWWYQSHKNLSCGTWEYSYWLPLPINICLKAMVSIMVPFAHKHSSGEGCLWLSCFPQTLPRGMILCP